MSCWLEDFVFFVAGSLLAHLYHRRATKELRELRASIDRLPVGLVDAVRNAAGQIKVVKAPPNAPTDLRIFTGPRR
jgi:hypothetical protein